jgi:hypothetical protein
MAAVDQSKARRRGRGGLGSVKIARRLWGQIDSG